MLFYDKCRRTGCKCNISAPTLHASFKAQLERYQVKKEYIDRIADELAEEYAATEKEGVQLYEQQNTRMEELKTSAQKLQEKYFIKEEMTKEIYDRLASKLTS